MEPIEQQWLFGRGFVAGRSRISRPSVAGKSDDLNHGLVLEQRVDLAQPVGPELVPIGQQDLEQTPIALSALNHARSFDESSCAGSVVRRIDRRNGRIDRLVRAGRRPLVPVSDLRGHSVTVK
jgi:hypothetical protein